MILIDKVYEIVTEESAQEGEIEESGFSAQNEPVSFRELVDMLKSEFIHASQSPANRSTEVWFTSEHEQDYTTGEYRLESLHFSRENPTRKAKYWIKAFEYAGFRVM